MKNTLGSKNRVCVCEHRLTLRMSCCLMKNLQSAIRFCDKNISLFGVEFKGVVLSTKTYKNNYRNIEDRLLMQLTTQST